MTAARPPRRRPIVVAQLEPIHLEVVLAVVNALRDDFCVHLVVHPLIAASPEVGELVSRHRLWTTPAPRRRSTRALFRRLRAPAAGIATLAIVFARVVGVFVGARTTIFTTIADPYRARLVRLLFPRRRVIHVLHNAQRYTGRNRSVLQHMAANAVITEDIQRFLECATDADAVANRAVAAHTGAAEVAQGDARVGARPIPGRHRLATPRIPNLTHISPITFPTSFIDGTVDSDQATRTFGVPRTDAGEIRVGIPGSVANHRRNYPGFLEELSRHRDLFVGARVRFFILGRTPDDFARELDRRGLESLVWTEPGFLPFERLYAGIAAMDIIAFLIDNSVEEAVNYNRTKASGTSILAVAFNKPVLSSRDFAVDAGLRGRTIWYPGAEIHHFARAIVDGEIDRASIARLALSPEEHAARHREAREEMVALVDDVIHRRATGRSPAGAFVPTEAARPTAATAAKRIP